MNYKYLFYGVLLLLVLFSLLFFAKVFFSISTNDCLKKETVDASITVDGGADRRFLGFNADVDSLKFGTVSQLALVQRSLRIENSENTMVMIKAAGDFSSWINIKPSEFYLEAQQTQEVFLNVNVPLNAADGDYSGQIEICFKSPYS